MKRLAKKASIRATSMVMSKDINTRLRIGILFEFSFTTFFSLITDSLILRQLLLCGIPYDIRSPLQKLIVNALNKCVYYNYLMHTIAIRMPLSAARNRRKVNELNSFTINFAILWFYDKIEKARQSEKR